MGFWVFMFLMSLLIPLIMVGSGLLFVRRIPSNMWVGYRTPMSTINQDTWAFAHLYSGRLMLMIGRVLLPLSVVAMVLMIGRDEDAIGIAVSIIMGAQVIAITISVILTEIALRKHFDKNGNRRF